MKISPMIFDKFMLSCLKISLWEIKFSKCSGVTSYLILSKIIFHIEYQVILHISIYLKIQKKTGRMAKAMVKS